MFAWTDGWTETISKSPPPFLRGIITIIFKFMLINMNVKRLYNLRKDSPFTEEVARKYEGLIQNT
jgi:hypothetical protein